MSAPTWLDVEGDTKMGTFAIGEEDFLLRGEPFRVLSGAIHYFRVHPDLWRTGSARPA